MGTPDSRGANSAVYETLLSALKRAKPSRVVAIQADATETAIAVRTGTTRWQQAAKIGAQLLANGADRIELRDDSGAVLDTVAVEQRPRAGEREAASVTQEERFLRLMLRAQEVALDRQSVLFASAFATNTELLRGMLSRINQLESAHTRVLKAQWDAVTAQAHADAALAAAEGEGDGGPLGELVKAFSAKMAKQDA